MELRRDLEGLRRDGGRFPSSGRTFRHACQVLVVRDSFSRYSVTITREQLEAWAGRELTDTEVDAIDGVIPNSSIPDAINEIVAAISYDDIDDSSTEPSRKGCPLT
jgi:hypothetical protein